MRRIVGLAFVAVLASALGGRAAPPPNAPAPIDPITAAVDELLAGEIGTGSCFFGAKKSIGIWPFAEDRVPVQAKSAQRVYDEIVARLVARRPPCLDILDGTAIGAIVAHLGHTGALQKKGGNVIAALEEANRRVDLVVMPQIYGQDGKIVLTLRGVERTSGRTLASTRPVIVPEVYLVGDLADLAVTLDAAIARAAHDFAVRVADLRAIRLGGFFYQDTAAQPAAGRYLMDRLVSALTGELANPVSGRALRVLEPSAASVDPAGEPGVWEVAGRYWLRGDAVDVKIQLRRGDGATHAWAGRIRLPDLAGLALRPQNAAIGVDDPGHGPFAFRLVSPRGRTPIYRPGEELTLAARSDRDAWMWCFYVDSAGAVSTVLPNPYRRRPDDNRIVAGEVKALPDPDRDPFRFVFNADTTGEEVVRCYATSRDVRRDLPPSFFPDPIGPIVGLDAARLDLAFARLADVEVGMAEVTVSVSP
ncbi:MAG: DUF4384 domain-containing protein [Hyphomicrobiales bacterium]|nr:DUF4384 domain-containing protein [Hyphomicrobiales bacterium]